MKPVIAMVAGMMMLALVPFQAQASGVAEEGELASRSGTVLLAQGGSCQAWLGTCTSRCRARLPEDAAYKKCVADVCGPKLAECRKSGCWHESEAFGGGRICSLAK